ncbi:hypothetical protein [Thermoanaerobacterium butyriciformans]|uniref:Recombinase n=1 Tax=Thermoanaerobacterium butyriciformans TaxID=1702242 RepID=A0ABS4ND08_9THEO|nr:hypothetical protein [Thermoanaerobacterium butyriciformans]MBP2070898.1 hypothetical protein [Thermoanaerobacterium butyriciformans]
MQVAIIKTTISRNKLKQEIYKPDEQKIIGYEEIDENKYYDPIAQFVFDKMKNKKTSEEVKE